MTTVEMLEEKLYDLRESRQEILEQDWCDGEFDPVVNSIDTQINTYEQQLKEAQTYTKESMERLQDDYDELSSFIAKRWQKIIGFGCGYFHRWEIRGDNVHVYYQRPSRLGGGIDPDPDIIPLDKLLAVE